MKGVEIIPKKYKNWTVMSQKSLNLEWLNLNFKIMDTDNKTESEKKEEKNAYRKKLGKPVNPELIGTEDDPQIPSNPIDEEEENNSDT